MNITCKKCNREIPKDQTGYMGDWGGDWTSLVDKPHFQLTLGYSLKDFQQGKVDYSKFE